MENLKNKITLINDLRGSICSDPNQCVPAVVLEDMGDQILVASFKGAKNFKPDKYYISTKNYKMLKWAIVFDGKIYLTKKSSVRGCILGELNELDVNLFVKELGVIDFSVMDEHDYEAFLAYLESFNRRNIIEGAVVSLSLSKSRIVENFFVVSKEEDYFTCIPLTYDPSSGLAVKSLDKLVIPYNSAHIVESYYLDIQRDNVLGKIEEAKLKLIK